ncbi:polysaccharide pyruvyl transferase CsaB [Thermus filiformis]|uniref:Pyruvyl transferase n=1 Tax=Thermus filiformis TaxID=276 RepID=A0A0A2WT13_THEFI|nr:polysaccharide pyruvyl transferase CsaB [Thermus filiformis]KGQ22963.1 pyruvyl transferase [Thermus filiformis]
MVVGVAGYYGFKNAGDEAILEAILQELRARGLEGVVLSGNPRLTQEQHHVRAVHRLNPFALLKAPLWLLGGGGLLQDKTSALSLEYYLGLVRLARFYRRKVVVFNQSLGPLSAWGEGRVRQVLRGVPLILRDQASVEYARSLGLSAELGADPALLLAPPPVPKEKDWVLLIPRFGEAYREGVKTLEKLAVRLAYEKKEVMVLLMQPGLDDLLLEDKEFDTLFRYFRTEKTSDPRRVLYLVAQAEYVVSMRLHGLILAAAAGTPFAGLAYDPKVAGFAKDADAYYQDLPGDPYHLAMAVLSRRPPDWGRVEAMKERARKSFDRVLEGVAVRSSRP